MTRPPRQPRTARVWDVLRPFVRVAAAVVGTLLLIALAFGVLPRLQQSPLRSPVVRVIIENRSERPLERVRLERSEDSTLLASTPEIPYGEHFAMERPLGEEFRWRLSFDQRGKHHVFDGFGLRPSHAELKVITVTPGPCIGGVRGEVVESR